MGGLAWVTLATNDSYSLGALVLAHSLRRVGTPHDLVVLIAPGVTESMREKLASVFTLVKEVNVLDSKDEANLAVLQRPELGITFTKLHCWRLTQYEKCVFVDADALVVRNCDELFEREELSAAPDVGWPDCFNSGVFVFRPSQQTFASLTAFAISQGSFDGADQGLLNMYFSDWAHKDISKHLPFIYNMCSTATYSYAPAFKQYGENVRIIHFIGNTKPWLQYFDTLTGIVQPPSGCNHLQPLLQTWWNIFCDSVHPQLTDVMGGLAGALSKLTLGESRTDEQRAIEDHIRKQNWEQGNVDFMGRDSFDNILKKINETLSSAPVKQSPPVQETRQPKKSSSKSSEVEAAVEESEVALPVLASEDQAESNTTLKSSEDTCQRISSSGDVSFSTNDNEQLTQTQTSPNLVASETIHVNKEATIISTKDTVESTIKSELKVDRPATIGISSQSQKETEASLSEKPGEPSSTEFEKETNISQVQISAAQIAAEILSYSGTTSAVPAQTTAQIISEAITEYPVPIQVAESVLQAEPKESVAEDPRPVIEAVVSSIIPPVQESAATISDTLVEPGQNESGNQQHQLNGNDPTLQLEAENTLPSTKSSSLISPIENVPSGQVESAVSIESERSQVIDQIEQQQIPVESQLAAEVEQKSTTLVETQPAASTELELAPQVEIQTAQTEPESVETQTVQTNIQPTAKIEVQATTQVALESSAQIESQAAVSVDRQPKTEIEPQSTAEVEPQAVGNDEVPSHKSKLTVSLPVVEESKDKTSESPVSAPKQPKLEDKDREDALIKAEESPVRPNRSKDLKIPGTPTVIEATPPTSPPLDIEYIESTEQDNKKQTETTETKENQAAAVICNIAEESNVEKENPSKEEVEPEPALQGTTKKIEKKSSAESDSPSTPEEGTTKKVVKKVVKKVSKKPKEGEEDSSSVEKPTKKIVKKVVKTSSSSLDTDQSVPGTPPPTGSEPPVPPKRKVKSSSSTKAAGKKPDES